MQFEGELRSLSLILGLFYEQSDKLILDIIAKINRLAFKCVTPKLQIDTVYHTVYR